MTPPLPLAARLMARVNAMRQLHTLIILLGALAMFVGYTALPLYCPLLILLFPPCLFWLALTSRSGQQAFTRGWYLGLWGYSASLYWLTVPMTTVGQMPLILAIPCVMFLGSALGLYTGLAAFCFRGLLLFLRPSSASRRPCLPQSPLKGFIMLLCTGLCYGGIELASAFILTGFPWLSLPVALAGLPFLIQSVSLVGTYGYSAVLTFLTLSPFLFFAHSKSFCPPHHSPRCQTSQADSRADAGEDSGADIEADLEADRHSSPTPPCTAIRGLLPWPLHTPMLCSTLWMVLIITGLGFYGHTALNLPLSDESVNVGIVQGNIDQNQKWSPAMQAATVEKHLALSRAAIKESPLPLNLLLWPETAMTFYYQRDEPYRSQLNAFARQNDISIAFGTLGYEYIPAQRAKQFNRLQLISPQGQPQGHYDKEHLVPFGEYNPIPFSISFLDNILQGIDFSAGHNQPLLALAHNNSHTLTDPNRRDSRTMQTGQRLQGQKRQEQIYQGQIQQRQINSEQALTEPEMRAGTKAHSQADAKSTTPHAPESETLKALKESPFMSPGVGRSSRENPDRHHPDGGSTDLAHSDYGSANHKSSGYENADRQTSPRISTALDDFDRSFSAPEEKTPLTLLGSLICYEVIFPALAQKRVTQGADILITISNDSWFGKTAAPQQHLNHAVLRAIEQRRSIVRSTTSGYSALILPNGIVQHKSALYEEAAYSFSAPLSKTTTIYHKFYQAIDALLLLGLCIAVVLGVKFRRPDYARADDL